MEDGSKKTRAQIDFEDLQNEIAGRDVGRISRFLSKEAIEIIKSRKGLTDEKFLNLLELLLLSDPEYAALYSEVWNTFDNAQIAVDQTLLDIERRLEKAEYNLSKKKDKASELSDGTKVFRSKDRKNAFTENERKLSEVEISSVQWKKDSPDWEDFESAKNERDQAMHDKREVEDYQENVLFPVREKLNDKDNPPSKEELKELLDDIEQKMPLSVKDNFEKAPQKLEMPSKFSAAKTYDGDAGMNVPDVNAQFNSARLDTTNSDTSPDLENFLTPGSSPKIIL